MPRIIPESTLPRIAMVSTHGYVAAEPPLGKADTGSQVVYVLELSKKLAQLGFEVDIWTRHFGDQPEIDLISERVRIIRFPCGGPNFIAKEYLCRHLHEWSENALRLIASNKLKYQFINSHYCDGGYASQRLAETLDVTNGHTAKSVARWAKLIRPGPPRPSSAPVMNLKRIKKISSTSNHPGLVWFLQLLVGQRVGSRSGGARKRVDLPPRYSASQIQREESRATA